MARLPVTLRALRYRNFRLFFAGQLISLIGTWMQNLAQSWLVYRLTGSLALLGAIGFTSQFPLFVLSSLGGIAADRYSRHRIVIFTQTASMLLAFILAALTLTHTVRIWHVFVLSALLGVVNSFDIPARQSFIVEMVGRPDLMNAIALNSSMFNASRVAGPAIAGIVVAAIGEGWCFFANAVSYIAVIIGLLMMHVPKREGFPPPTSPWAHLVEGFRFVFENTPVHALLALLGLVSLTGMPFSVLMPAFADRILHGGAKALGLLMGATGIGALIAALLLASRQHLRGLHRWVAIAATVFSITLVAFAWSRLFWLSMTLLALVGFSMMIQMGASNTLIQSMVPDRLRGRIMAIYSMMLMGMAPFGALLAGIVAQRFGAPFTVAAGGVICLIAAVIFATQVPKLRSHARRLLADQKQ